MARHDELERHLRACFDAAVAAVEPERLVRDFLTGGEDGAVTLQERVWIIGFGKAAAAMARGAVDVLGDRIAGGVLVVPAGQASDAPEGLAVFEGGHPVPTAEGVEGARAIERLADAATSDELVLVLVSGGGSALMTLPPPRVSLGDVQTTTGALLQAGADIAQLNTVRKHLDLLKGGQLARAAMPAPVLALVLSDVVGDPLDVIASGPVSPDPSTFEMAIATLERFDLWSAAPSAVRVHLQAGAAGTVPETPAAGDACFSRCEVHVVGNNEMAAQAACAEAKRLGYWTELTSTRVIGEARDAGAALARAALDAARSQAGSGAPLCLISAGETTVTVTGSGKGGRNQEVALGAALALAAETSERPIVIASLGTDGIDGPTDAAGAIATDETLTRAGDLGLDAGKALADNDAYPFFQTLGDLVVTGATGTNVMDLQIVMIGRRPAPRAASEEQS